MDPPLCDLIGRYWRTARLAQAQVCVREVPTPMPAWLVPARGSTLIDVADKPTVLQPKEPP